MANNRVLVTAEEEQTISRAMMAWVNGWSGLPDTIIRVDFEQLAADKPSMALSTVQGAYITRRYITGGHQGEYQFQLIYRIKPGNSNDQRLKADELLNAFEDWAVANLPDLGNNVRVIRLEPNTRSSMLAVYENGDEDHQILMKLVYEVL
ncbi:MAG: hypothetical protein II433_09945 [Acidaminococcaceae bacterium]|nr:hypothetical protein [Acidaminococcaceae bacterium]